MSRYTSIEGHPIEESTLVDATGQLISGDDTDGQPVIFAKARNYVWDTNLLQWVRETQPGGGGGGGGAVTVADGADVAEGATADVKVLGDTAGTVSAKLRGINTALTGTLTTDVTDRSGRLLGHVTVDNASLAVTESGTWNVGLSAGSNLVGVVKITDSGGTNQLAVNASGQVAISNFPATQPVSGTVTANQGSPPWQVVGNVASGAADSGNPAKVGGIFNTTQPTVTSGQRVDLQATARGELLIAKGVTGFSIDNTGFNVNNSPTVNQGGAPWSQNLTQVAGTALGATAVTNFGTAPAAAAVPGINASLFSGTTGLTNTGSALDVNLKTSAATVTVSGTVTTTPPANASTNVTQFGGTNVSTGTGVSGAGVPRVTVASDSNILATQSGTWTVQQGTPPWQIVGNVASGAADSGNPAKIGGVFNTTQPTVTNAQRVDAQATARGELLIAKGVSGFSIDNTSFVATQATAANLNATVTGTVTTTPPSNASTNVTQFGGTNISTGTGASGVGIPRVTIANDSNILATQSGTWNVGLNTGSNVIGHVIVDSGTVTSNQGTAAAVANAWPIKFTDGSNPITAGDNANNAVRVNVVAGGAGGGVAQLQVQDSTGTWKNVGFLSGFNVPVGGPVAEGTTLSTPYPVIVGGQDVVNVTRAILTDGTGAQYVTMKESVLTDVLQELKKVVVGLSVLTNEDFTQADY